MTTEREAHLSARAKVGNASFGKNTCSVSVNIDRQEGQDSNDLAFMDLMLCGSEHRCQMRMNPDQKPLIPDDDSDLFHGSSRCQGFGVRGDHLSFTLSFARNDVDVAKFARLSQQTVKLELTRTGAWEKPKRGSGDDEPLEDDGTGDPVDDNQAVLFDDDPADAADSTDEAVHAAIDRVQTEEAAHRKGRSKAKK